MKSISGILLIAIAILFISGCKNKPRLDKDLLVTDICNAFKADNTDEPDSDKFDRIISQHLKPYLNEISEDSAKSLAYFIDARLQRECLAYSDLLNRPDGSQKGDWKHVDVEPQSKISGSEYETFISHKTLKYLEANGDTTVVLVTPSTWEDHFIDDTYSKLSLEKLSSNEFVLTFITSNNLSRKNFSKPGDKYRYKLLEKTENYYLVFAQPVGTEIKALFKLYF